MNTLQVDTYFYALCAANGGCGGSVPVAAPARRVPAVRDGFDGTALGLVWQWPVLMTLR